MRNLFYRASPMELKVHKQMSFVVNNLLLYNWVIN